MLAGTAVVFVVGNRVFQEEVLPRADTVASPPQTEVIASEETIVEESLLVPSSPPISRACERVTKKPFGVWIDPETSPVSPERFSGYHTGVDFEIFSDEADQDVPVYAICDGEVVRKEWVSGYGGVLITECEFEEDPITTLYGHIRLSSVVAEVGDRVNAEDFLGFLGEGGSRDTDGERKHLHLGIHRGRTIEYRGYVQNESELEKWIDPYAWVCVEAS